MEKYDNLGVVGEGSYGVVMKCRHRESGQIVAVKKFLETEEDLSVRKMALREVRMLRRLRHENLVNMIEAFRRKKRFHIVFEFMDRTILDELEATGGRGLAESKCREYIFQVVRGVDFCHVNNVIHRDIKPENILVSNSGVVKLCDFGFARLLTGAGDIYTEYVATRWYRAPELLVPDPHYGKPVDIWAVGCLFAEIMAGDPLFPGDSDIDQLFLIMKVMGRLSQRHQQLLLRNPIFRGLKRCDEGITNLQTKFPNWSLAALDFLGSCLKMDPLLRPSSADLVRHLYLTKDEFQETFLPVLRKKILDESEGNPLQRKLQGSAPRRNKDRAEPTEDKSRKSTLTEIPRWKFNSLTEECRKNALDASKSNTSWIRHEPMDTSAEDVENRREVRGWDSATPLSPLQPLPSVLHPSISNLYFTHEAEKAPPQLFPSKGPGTRSQFLRKLDRPVDNIFSKDRDINVPSPQPWVSNKKAVGAHGWKSRGGMDDDFSLPNLPGVAASPYKSTKKKSGVTWKEGMLVPTPPPRKLNSQPPSAASRSKHSGLPHM